VDTCVNLYVDTSKLRAGLKRAAIRLFRLSWQEGWSPWPRPPLRWDAMGIADALLRKQGKVPEFEHLRSITMAADALWQAESLPTTAEVNKVWRRLIEMDDPETMVGSCTYLGLHMRLLFLQAIVTWRENLLAAYHFLTGGDNE